MIYLLFGEEIFFELFQNLFVCHFEIKIFVKFIFKFFFSAVASVLFRLSRKISVCFVKPVQALLHCVKVFCGNLFFEIFFLKFCGIIFGNFFLDFVSDFFPVHVCMFYWKY